MTCTQFRKSAVCLVHDNMPQLKAQMASSMCHNLSTAEIFYKISRDQNVAVEMASQYAKLLNELAPGEDTPVIAETPPVSAEAPTVAEEEPHERQASKQVLRTNQNVMREVMLRKSPANMPLRLPAPPSSHGSHKKHGRRTFTTMQTNLLTEIFSEYIKKREITHKMVRDKFAANEKVASEFQGINSKQVVDRVRAMWRKSMKSLKH